MKEFDIVKQQILEIEDFENVDTALMEKIQQSEEYRILFEEIKNLSATIGNIAPSPEKDGESLHSAVMKRVKEGDIAPRYINTQSFRFPFATVACLCVVVAVVLMSKSGFMERKMSDNAEVEMDAVYENGDGNAGGADAKISNMYDYSYEVADREIAYDEAEEEAIVEEEKAQEMRTETVRDDRVAEGAELKKKSEEQKADSYENEDAGYTLEPEVILMLSKAEQLCGQKDVITAEIIVKLGAENYISFFESIAEKDNFKELYTPESFIAFCENKQ